MGDNESRRQGATAKLGDALSWIATNLVLFAGLWVPFMLEWFLFGSRGVPDRTLGRQAGDVIAGLLLVGAMLSVGSVLYLVLLLGVGRRRLPWQRRVIAIVLSPIVGLIIWFWGPFSLGTLIYGLVFPLLCGLIVRFPYGDRPGHLVFSAPGQHEAEERTTNGDKRLASSPGDANDSPRWG